MNCALLAVATSQILLAMKVEEQKIGIRSQRQNVQIPVITISPSDPWGAMLILPGGNGILNDDVGKISSKNDFLLRTAKLFAEEGLQVFIPGPASDQNRWGYKFRTSSSHLQDLKSLATVMKNQSLPFWIAASSRGTISASWASDVMSDAKGMILLSPITHIPRHHKAVLINSKRIKNAKIPTLIVSNRFDRCPVSPIKGAYQLKEELKHIIPVDFVEISDGLASSKEKKCSPLGPHGFGGNTKKVMKVINDWMESTLNNSQDAVE